MRIVVLGFMGCGKSTTGAALAERLGLEFADLDQEIESEIGSPVPEIFKNKGEDQFRKLEQDALIELMKRENIVIAVGGGAPCFFNNMDLINKNAVSVYLKMSVESLFGRLVKERIHRPLISEFNQKELKKFISDCLLTREPYYNKADYKVKAKDIEIGTLADRKRGVSGPRV